MGLALMDIIDSVNGYSRGKPDVNWWIGEVRQGLQFRKEMAFEDKWELWRRYYRGQWNERILPINVFFKMVRSLVPRVYFRNPGVSITPTKPGLEYTILAQLLERVDNKLLVQMRTKEQMKTMVQDTFMFGTAIMKLGFGAQYTPTPDLVDARAPLGERNSRGMRLEYHSLIKANMPWLLRLHPGQFIVPAYTCSWREARWACHWLRRHIDEIRDDPRFENTKNIEPVGRLPRELATRQTRTMEGMVDLMEIRDKKTQRVFVIAPYQSEKVLFDSGPGGDELQVDGQLPYFPLVFNQDPECFWGIPDAQILEPQQRELNEIRTLIMKHRRISLVKILSNVKNMTPDEEAKLVGEEVGAIVHAEDINAVKVLTESNIPEGLIRSDALVQADVREILGLGQNQWGEFVQGSEKPSATEAAEVAQASAIRSDERRDTCADLLTEAIEQIHPIIFDRWGEEIVMDILGPAGIPVWIRFRPEVLREGSYEVKVDPDSAIPETRQVREARAERVYALLRTNPLIDPLKLTQYLLHQMHGTQFDDMMLSPLTGPGSSPLQPMDLSQYAQLLPQFQQIAGQLGTGLTQK